MEMWGEEGLSNLPVCRIFRRGSDGYSSCSLRSGEAEFVQLFLILQVPHAAKQSIPCFCINISVSNSQIYHCT